TRSKFCGVRSSWASISSTRRRSIGCGLRLKGQRMREIFEVCILTLGHSLESFRGRSSPARIHLPACRSRVNSLWFLFAELLEARIVPKGIEHWIEPEERRSERQVVRKFSVYCFGASEATIFSKRGSPPSGSRRAAAWGWRVGSGAQECR